MTNCPLCGFRQRIDRLTGLEFQVKDMERDLLPLEALLVYSDKGVGVFRAEKHPVSLPPEVEQEMLYALAAKLLPLVRHLQLKVPEFREATTDVLEVMIVFDQVVEQDIYWPIGLDSGAGFDSGVGFDGGAGFDSGVRFDREVDEAWLNVKLGLDAPLILPESWKHRKSGIKSWKKSSEPFSPKREWPSPSASPSRLEILSRFDQPVPMEIPTEIPVNQKEAMGSG